jgi:tRNA(Ile)-lysidine synthase
VRAELLPLLEREYNPQIIPLLNQFADRARDDEACLEQLARELSQASRRGEEGEERISIRALAEFPPAVARRVLRQMLQAVRGSSQGLSHAHIESLRRFAAEAQSGKVKPLPGGVVARREFSWLVLSPKSIEPEGLEFCYQVTIPGDFGARELGCTYHFKILTRGDHGREYNLNKLSALDPRKLVGELVLRNWRAGDSFSPIGSRGVRKVKELFRERKIPEVRRKGWPVLLCAGKIVWVRGFPPDRSAAATDEAPRVLIVEEEPLQQFPATSEGQI